MQTKHYFNLPAFIILLFVLFLSNIISGQENYFVPADIPKATYTLELDFDFQSGILTGQGNLEFKNEGKRAIHLIAFDYALNDYQLLKLIQDGKELRTFSNDGNKSLNNPVYFILDIPIVASGDFNAEIQFKRRLFTDEDPEEFENQNLIPRLWWDDIPVSDAFRIKLNKLPDYTIAVSGRYNEIFGVL